MEVVSWRTVAEMLYGSPFEPSLKKAAASSDDTDEGEMHWKHCLCDLCPNKSNATAKTSIKGSILQNLISKCMN